MNNSQMKREGARTRRDFDETYRRNAVQLTLQTDRSVKQIAEELGITDGLLYNWRKRYGPAPAGSGAVRGELSPEQKDEEIVRLRAEVHRRRESEIILKNSLGIVFETRERYSNLQRMKAEDSVDESGTSRRAKYRPAYQLQR